MQVSRTVLLSEVNIRPRFGQSQSAQCLSFHDSADLVLSLD